MWLISKRKGPIFESQNEARQTAVKDFDNNRLRARPLDTNSMDENRDIGAKIFISL